MLHKHRRNLGAVESADAEGSVTGPPLAACAEIESCPTALGSSKQQRLATESARLNRQEEQALAEEGMGSDREVWPPY